MREQFQIRENGIKEARKATLTRMIPMVIFLVGLGHALSYFNTVGESVSPNTLAIVSVVVAISFSLFLVIKRQKKQLESYSLTLTENEIIREQFNTPTINIQLSDIKSINKTYKGHFTIVGKSNYDLIIVPSQIETPARLETLLSEIHPIAVSEKKYLSAIYTGLFTLLTIGLMVTVSISTNKLVVGITGLLLICILGFSVYSIRRNKNIDKRVKYALWFMLPLFFSIIATMYFKLSGKV